MEIVLPDWRVGALAASGLLNLALAGALVGVGHPAERRLAAVLVTLSGLLAPFVLIVGGIPSEPPWLVWLPSFPLALGPLLWGYIRAQTRGPDADSLWRHLIPAAVHLGWKLSLIALFLTGGLGAGLREFQDAYGRDAFDAAGLVSLVVYGWASLREVGVYRRWLPQNRSDADRYAAVWFSRLILGLLALLAAFAVIRPYTWFIGELTHWQVFSLYVILAVFGAYAGVEGWRCSERRFPAMREGASGPAAPGRDWTAQGEAWREQLREAGWWREPELSSATLARRLGTNVGYLSRAFNVGLGRNFAEVVNGMRAEAVAERLMRADPGNLLEIAFAAGFSSKASFNRAFRAMHGMSPSAFAAQFQKNLPGAKFEATATAEPCNQEQVEVPHDTSRLLGRRRPARRCTRLGE